MHHGLPLTPVPDYLPMADYVVLWQMVWTHVGRVELSLGARTSKCVQTDDKTPSFHIPTREYTHVSQNRETREPVTDMHFEMVLLWNRIFTILSTQGQLHI